MGKYRTVSSYLCCIPGILPSPKLGMLSSICPAGCGFSFIRTACAAASTSALGASRASRSDRCATSPAGSMSSCGKTSR
ncbi:hypothetical protein BJF79_07780 [Actinomadura sp. CNU-125]|nr:hypothetical protein BJF79_07780 [Actinomadura sp. CNU-125]